MLTPMPRVDECMYVSGLEYVIQLYIQYSNESSNWEYESDSGGSGDYDPDFGTFDDY